MRTVLYARFSSHLQNARSIDDQIAMLTSHAEREGWEIVGVFTDYAISGAAGIDGDQRPGLAALLDRLSRRDIDWVFAESTDRLARHEGDAFAIRERIEFTGARLFTLNDGEVDDIKGAIKGLFDSRFRKELGAKVRRGQRGTVKDGRAPAGKAYGYAIANRIDDRGRPVRGLRIIDEAQAAIVLRIFSEFADGRSTRAIAEGLNDDGIIGPSGAGWRLTTIHGDRKRMNGMLNNELYIGELVWNRTSKVRDPETRRTLIRPNPESEWQRQSVPHLRIVDDVLWRRVKARQAAMEGKRPEQLKKPMRLLSGLVRCGKCGGGWIVVSKTYWGCGRHKDGGCCTNRRRIRGDRMEARVLAGLSDHLMLPEHVALYVAERHKVQAQMVREAGKQAGRIDAELARIQGKMTNLVEAIANGGSDFAEIRDTMTALKARREQLNRDRADIEQPSVITLMPNFADEYRRRWSDLQAAFGEESCREKNAPALRAMIDKITLTPDPKADNGLAIEISGKLRELLAFATGNKTPEKGTTAMERVTGIIRCSA